MSDNGGYAQTHLSMGDRSRKLKGSPSRDLFKQLHKTHLPAFMFACDVDLRLVEKNPWGVVANLDAKVGRDSITFTEVIGYNHDLRTGVQVFIVQAADEDALAAYSFTIREYLGGDPRPNPPTVTLGAPVTINGFAEWEAWEQWLRATWKAKQANRGV